MLFLNIASAICAYLVFRLRGVASLPGLGIGVVAIRHHTGRVWEWVMPAMLCVMLCCVMVCCIVYCSLTVDPLSLHRDIQCPEKGRSND